MKLTMIIPFLVLAFIPSSFALETDNSYLLDDNEFVSILLDIDSSGNASFTDVFITSESGDQFVLNVDSARIVRISDDFSFGKIFGQTESGEFAYITYQINGDNVELKAKVWTDTGKERIVSNGEIIPLF